MSIISIGDSYPEAAKKLESAGASYLDFAGNEDAIFGGHEPHCGTLLFQRGGCGGATQKIWQFLNNNLITLSYDFDFDKNHEAINSKIYRITIRKGIYRNHHIEWLEPVEKEKAYNKIDLNQL